MLRIAVIIFIVVSMTPEAYGQLSGKELYESACAACHASDGKGNAASAVGFEIPLPDFTDCSFASREPDDDWMAVIHHGGPARAFDRMMPSYRDALGEAEQQRILDHVRTFCTDKAWPRGELNLPRPLITEKAFPEDEAVLTVTANAEGAGAVSQSLLYERRFGPRNQIEVVFPMGIRERAPGSWIGGIGDIAVAFKRAVLHSIRSGSIFSVAGEVVLPTGNQDKGLGGGKTIFEPFVAFGQVLPSAGFVQVQGGFELPADRDETDEAFWRTAIGKTFAPVRFGRAWSPMIELLGSRELVSLGRTHWDVVPQMQVSLSTRQHVLVNAGVRLPVNDRDLRTTQVIVYVLWDWFDGGLFSGW
jgi:hypothetical protein